MNNVTLSVIVPVYNVEDYLKKCVESIINQTYKDLEIILVDDGSTDNSGVICEEYAKLYKNIFVYHKKNGGLSSARNYGIDKAKGEYLAFIDSDDFIESNMFEVLVKNAVDNNSDISMCDYYIYFDENNFYPRTISEKNITVYKDNDVLWRLYTEFCACNKIFKKNLFDEVRYPEGKLYEDARTTYLLAAKAKCAVVTPLCFYNYRQRNTSIMNTFSTKNYADRVNVYNEIYDFVKTRFSSKQLFEIAHKKNKLIIELLMSILKNKKLSDNKKLVRYLVKSLEKPVLSCSKYSLKEKLVITFLRFFN